MRLILVRHGRQESPLCNVNVALSEEGILQAKLLAKRFSGLRPDLVYTSSLLRAKQTASLLFGEDAVFLERAELDEISFGNLTGLSDAESRKVFPAYYAAKKRRENNLRIPGGECPTEVFERANKIVLEALNSGAETVVFVTHGGVIRALTAGLLGLGSENMLRIAEELEHCSITELLYSEESGCFSLERLNDYAHLEADIRLLRCSWKK